MKKLTRCIRLKAYPNFQKSEDIRYTIWRHRLYAQHFTTQLYYRPHVRYFSTFGMGHLADRAQHRAIGILSSHRAAIRVTGDKSNCPQLKNIGTPAVIRESKSSSFDYWVAVMSQWNHGGICVPVKSHKRLKYWLNKGWLLNHQCEIKQIGKEFYVYVWVQKYVAKPVSTGRFLGVDVGLKHGVSRSDGYLGRTLSPIIKRFKEKNAERRRQNHLTKSAKTNLKQQLDIEVKRAIARCIATSSSLAVESPKILANLKIGKLHGWGRCYFANRAEQVGWESGVYVKMINPSYSSVTCHACGNCDKRSRDKLTFKCVACGNRTHADINAARVLTQRATVSGRKIPAHRKAEDLLESARKVGM